MPETNDFMEKLKNMKEKQAKKEPELLFSNKNMIGIYQLREDAPNLRDLEFADLSWLEKSNLSVDSDNYELVYAFDEFGDNYNDYFEDGNFDAILDEVYRDFNVTRPSDYPGYSLSVSHIVAIRTKDNNDNYYTRFYYCNDVGFIQIGRFEEKLIDKYRTTRKFSFTGQFLSDEMLDILDRTERGEVVSIDEINDTKEIKYCKSITENGIETIYLSNRQDKQREIIDQINSLGSATELDSDGNMQYNGYIERDSRLDIVIGLPASGKSSAIVDSLSQEFHSRLIDNDMVKAGFTEEFRDGLGGRLVHQESKMLEKEIFRTALSKGENIVFPKVGGSVSSILGYIQQAKASGYTVNLHFVNLQREKVFNRLLNRLLDSGRYVEPELIDKYYPLDRGNLCKQTFDFLKVDEKLISGYSEWDNDVARGERPILIDYSNLVGDFIDEGVKNNERREAERIGNDSDLRSVRDGGYSGEWSVDNGREDKYGFREQNGVSTDIESNIGREILKDFGKDRRIDKGMEYSRVDGKGQEDINERDNQFNSKEFDSRNFGSERDITSGASRRNGDTNFVGERENRDDNREVSGDSTELSLDKRIVNDSETKSERTRRPVAIELIDERENQLIKAFDIRKVLDSQSEEEYSQAVFKDQILKLLSGRISDGSRFGFLEFDLKNNNIGSLKNVFDYLDSLEEPFDKDSITIETIYGEIKLSDISLFDKVPLYNMSNQNGTDWYVINSSYNLINGPIVFNDNDIIGCKAAFGDIVCSRTTELTNPLYNYAINLITPFPLNNRTFRLSNIGEDFSYDITLYRDDFGNTMFYIEDTLGRVYAKGDLGEYGINRDSAIKVAEEFQFIDNLATRNLVDANNFVVYDVLDQGLTEEYIKKADYTFYNCRIDMPDNSNYSGFRFIYSNGLMYATNFRRYIEENTSYSPDIKIIKNPLFDKDFTDSEVLANYLDNWYSVVDHYDYLDRTNNSEENVADIKKAIDEGNTEDIKQFLKDFIDENKNDSDLHFSEVVDDARILLVGLNEMTYIQENKKKL